MKKKKAALGIVIGIAVMAIIATAVFLVINLTKKDNDDVGEIYYYQTPAEHIAEENGISFADNEILVVANEGVSKKDIEQLAEKYGAEIVGYIEVTGDYQWKLTEAKSKEEIDSLIKEISNEEIVESSSKNLFLENNVNSEIQYGKKWKGDLKNPTDMKGKSWGVEAINAPEAWNLMNEKNAEINPVRVGVIDSGFNESHEDLIYSQTFYNDKFEEFWQDAQKITDKKERSDRTTHLQHGTHVSGTMAANGTNDKGICGVYPYAEQGGLYGAVLWNNELYSENTQSLICLKVCLAELVLRNVKVINCSFGTSLGVELDYYRSVNDALHASEIESVCNEIGEILGEFLRSFISKGYDFLIVATSGNDSNKNSDHGSSGIEISVYVPDENGNPGNQKQKIYHQTNDISSLYESHFMMIPKNEYGDVGSQIICVGAIDKSFQRCNFSNIDVDVYAPGEDIYSTVPVNKYEHEGWQGTSMAAPHVAGIVASVWSINNNLSGAQIKAIIRNATNMEHTNLPIVDMASAVRVAFLTRKYNENIADIPSGNGMIMGFVVDGENYTVTENGIEEGAIEAAEIVVKNADTGEKVEPTVKTDSSGHFEIILPAGNYKLTVNAEGYNVYEWPETVKVEDGRVNYLSDWIKLPSFTFSDFPTKYTFTSGFGAWATVLTLSGDGKFEGIYHDSDAISSNSIKYPKGTFYYSTFNGKFKNPGKISDTSYSMQIETLNIDNNIDKVYYGDGVEYIASEPYGIENAKELIIYLPGTKIEDVDEECLAMPSSYFFKSGKLADNCVLLCNMADKTCFVGYYENNNNSSSVSENKNENESKLSKEEIKKLYIEANSLFDGWICHGWEPELDFNDTITKNGREYARVVSGRFHSVAELEKELKNYFSSEIYKDRLDRYYTMHDNKLYGIVELGQGGDMSPDKYGLSISSETDNECVFIITNYYSNGEKFDSEHKITYQNGKWIFVDEFIENMY